MSSISAAQTIVLIGERRQIKGNLTTIFDIDYVPDSRLTSEHTSAGKSTYKPHQHSCFEICSIICKIHKHNISHISPLLFASINPKLFRFREDARYRLAVEYICLPRKYALAPEIHHTSAAHISSIWLTQLKLARVLPIYSHYPTSLAKLVYYFHMSAFDRNYRFCFFFLFKKQQNAKRTKLCLWSKANLCSNGNCAV